MEFFSNNTKQIYKVPKALASVALAAGQAWVLNQKIYGRVRLKPRFKYRQWVSQSYYCLRQWVLDGAEQQKARLVKSVLANGLSSSGTADERSVRSLTWALMWRLRYVGAVTLLQLLKVNTATLYSM